MNEVLVKKDIRNISSADLIKILGEIGEPAFRAKQILDWLWAKSAHSFDDMTNLSKALREKLKEQFSINAVRIHQSQPGNGGGE